MSEYSGTIDERGDSESFYIKLLKGKTYIIDLLGTGSDPLDDPTLSLIGDNGQFAEDDNGGGGKRSQIFLSPDRIQYYEITASGHGGSTGDFRLRVNADDYRNGLVGVAPAGQLVTDGRSRHGTIDYVHDSDAFSLNLIGGLSYNFRMHARNEASADARLVLLSEDGDRLASDSDSGPDNSASLSFRADSTGAHWLIAKSENDGTGDYSVIVGVGHGSASADRVTGTDFGDQINVLGGNDRVDGGLGDDRIWGASGKDLLDGGDGRDRINGGLGDDRMHGEAGADRLFGEDGGDRLFGEDGNDRLDGGEGDDILSGGGGYDNLLGDAGNDSLYGGDRRDSLDGGDGDDRLSGAEGGDYLVSGIGNDKLIGGEGSDYLYAGEGDDRLSGGAGYDVCFGEDGDDTVLGAGGNDYAYGGDGSDAIFGEAGDDWSLGGDEGDDRISGGSGNDNLYGGEGDDLLTGGRNGDGLFGEDGNDRYLFNKISDSRVSDPDVIYDFEGAGRTGGDLFDLTAIDADRTLAGSQTLRFDDGIGKGSVWLEDDSARNSTTTLLYINVDDDDSLELLVRIEDGRSVTASDYSSADFLL